MDKAGIANRLSRVGLRNIAEAYKEEVRQRLARTAKEEAKKDPNNHGKGNNDRQAATDAAWADMWELFRPIVQRIEKEKAEIKAAAKIQGNLIEKTPNLDDFLDPNYDDSKPENWVRDGLLWTAKEIARVVSDTAEGTVVDLNKAKTPLPVPYAYFVLTGYARRPPEKRIELITKVLPFANKQAATADDEGDYEPNEFLDRL